MSELIPEHKEAFDEVVSLLGQCISASVPYAKYCEEALTVSETFSKKNLLFATFLKCCFDSSIDDNIPDEAFITVLCCCLDVSEEIVMVILGRFNKHISKSSMECTNEFKIKMLLVSLLKIKFSKNIAIAKQRLSKEMAVEDLSSIVQQYSDTKVNECSTLRRRYLLSTTEADVHSENIRNFLLSDSESLLTPLSMYPITHHHPPSVDSSDNDDDECEPDLMMDIDIAYDECEPDLFMDIDECEPADIFFS